MTNPVQSILDSALALSEADRAMLVERLLEALSADEQQAGEEELFAELESAGRRSSKDWRSRFRGRSSTSRGES